MKWGGVFRLGNMRTRVLGYIIVCFYFFLYIYRLAGDIKEPLISKLYIRLLGNCASCVYRPGARAEGGSRLRLWPPMITVFFLKTRNCFK